MNFKYKHTSTRRIHFSKELLFTNHASYVVPKGSPLKRSFNEILEWARDTGLIEKLEMDAYKECEDGLPSGKRNEQNREQPLDMLRMSPCFAIWILGFIISLVVFGLEKRSISKRGRGAPTHKKRFL